MLVLVTGATGFIGRRLVARLAADGVRVRAMALPGEDVAAIPELAGPGVSVVRADVTEPASLTAAVAGVERVYHLAAVVGDWGEPARFLRVNVEGTRNVLDAAAAAGVARVLMVSSIVVYGWQLHDGGCDEVSARREHGVGPYSRTKRASEELALDYHAMGRVPVTVVRPGNVYGPHSAVWVDTLVALLRKRGAVWIGDGGGDATLAYVDNVVDVIARAAASPDAAGRIYNANDGAGVTWRRYLTDLAELAGADAPRRSIPLPVARALGATMERAWRLARRPTRPLLTDEAVVLMASGPPVPIARAERELGYRPLPYADAMREVGRYLQGG